MNQEKFQLFSEAYRKSLKEAMEEHPEKYFLLEKYDNPSEIVSNKMLKAIQENPMGVNYGNSLGFKKTCKTLGIKYTRKAIFEFLEIA